VADLIARVLERGSKLLLKAARSRRLADFPGSLTVGGQQVTQLHPLGGFHRPGITKAGRLSFRGVCGGRTVKVYGVHSPAQAALRLAVRDLTIGGCAFPEVIAADDHLVVEAWIDGEPVEALAGDSRSTALAAVDDFFHARMTDRLLLDLAASHAESFCYIEHYLFARLGPWRHWDPVRSFIAAWQAARDRLEAPLPRYLSHPDISGTNLMRERSSGRLLVIDNELLGVGPGWILDGRNAWQGDMRPLPVESGVPASFIELTWRLRQLGSALDAGNFRRAAAIASGA